jgi:hypothetical protein
MGTSRGLPLATAMARLLAEGGEGAKLQRSWRRSLSGSGFGRVRSRSRVHVGFEIPTAERRSLEAFLAGTGDERLRERDFWSGSYHDGRTSVAMLALLAKLRDDRRRGEPIDVFFFDDPDRLTVQRRDEAMAENISLERSRAPGDIYLIEVGNLHARAGVGAPWDSAKQWMGTFLASREPRGQGHLEHLGHVRRAIGEDRAFARGRLLRDLLGRSHYRLAACVPSLTSQASAYTCRRPGEGASSLSDFAYWIEQFISKARVTKFDSTPVRISGPKQVQVIAACRKTQSGSEYHS